MNSSTTSNWFCPTLAALHQTAIAGMLAVCTCFPSLANDDLAAEAKEVFRANCAECHSDEDARADLRILDQPALLEAEYIVPKKPDESHIYQLITSTDDDAMPPTSRPSLTTEQIAAVRKWITAGAKAFPVDAVVTTADATNDTAPAATPTKPVENFLADKQVLNSILDHSRSVPRAERRFLRYFSLRHLLDSGVTHERLKQHRLALAKAINHLSRERELVLPTPIDASKTVLAIDLRQIGWHQKTLQAIDDNAKAFNLFDVVLLEYPYSIVPTDSDTFDQVADELLKSSIQIRPIPYVRADWFCSVVLQPPLYHDILQLPRTLEQLETDLGVDVESNLESGLAKRAGMTVSGVSRNNRAVERHPHRDGYYWKSHDFQSNVGSENILSDPIDFRPSGGEMIFRLPNGMQAYYVCDARGRRIDTAPTSIVVDKFASDRVVSNGLGCIRCHRQGIKDFNDNVRDVLLTLPGNPGFDKRKALQLYPTKEKWNKQIEADRAQFAAAMAKLGDPDPRREPLAGITADFLEGTLSVAEAAAELGVNAADLKTSCRAPGFTRLGLAPLASGSVIRRDAWEHGFDAVATLLGAGTPIVALDGNLRREYVPNENLDKIELRTNKKNNFFEPGDKLRVSVVNNSTNRISFELYGTSIEGKKIRLTQGVESLKPKETFSFPKDAEQFIEIRGGLGQEEITLFASTDELPPGTIFRGKNVADRVVHPFYSKGADGTRNDASTIVKKTILIETK